MHNSPTKIARLLSVLSVYLSSFLSSSFDDVLTLFLNSLIALPIALPISGSFAGPNIISAITKINISSVGPILEKILSPLIYNY